VEILLSFKKFKGFKVPTYYTLPLKKVHFCSSLSVYNTLGGLKPPKTDKNLGLLQKSGKKGHSANIPIN
jgi:hypothetical protein